MYVTLVAKEDSFGVIARQDGVALAKAIEQFLAGERFDTLEDFAAEQCSRVRAILCADTGLFDFLLLSGVSLLAVLFISGY